MTCYENDLVLAGRNVRTGERRRRRNLGVASVPITLACVTNLRSVLRTHDHTCETRGSVLAARTQREKDHSQTNFVNGAWRSQRPRRFSRLPVRQSAQSSPSLLRPASCDKSTASCDKPKSANGDGIAYKGDPLIHGSLPVLPSGEVDYSSFDTNPLSMIFANTLRKTLVEEVKVDSRMPGYAGLVELFHVVNDMEASPDEIQDRAARIFKNFFADLYVGWIPPLWRDVVSPLLPPTLGRWWFFLMIYLFFQWFVGPVHGAECIEIEVSPQLRDVPLFGALLPKTVSVPQAAKIERCRCLEQTACASVCVNSCKIPCEAVFKEEFGMDLHIQPNYEDFSCKWVFGKKPPPLAEEEALQVPCFKQCPAVQRGTQDKRKAQLGALFSSDKKKCKGMDMDMDGAIESITLDMDGTIESVMLDMDGAIESVPFQTRSLVSMDMDMDGAK